MLTKYATGTRQASAKYHNQSQDVNSRNSAKQVNNYIANKILACKFNDNKSHGTSLSNTKDAKRMQKLVFLGDQITNKKTSDKIRPQIKNSCDSVRRSQKRNAKARYYEKSNTSKLSEAKKGTSKKKKKTNFNNTIKLSSNYANLPTENYMGSIPSNSKYTVSLSNNNRSGAK